MAPALKHPMSHRPSQRRELISYSGLLVLSFVATYGYLAIQNPALIPVFASANYPTLPRDSAVHAQGMASSPEIRHESPEGAANSDEANDSAAAHDPFLEEREQAHSAAVDAGRIVVTGLTVEARRAAMIQLGSMASRLANGPEPELLRSLESAAIHAAEWQIRLSAVNALAGVARQMQDPSPVTRILEQASRDPHKAVARRSTDALQELQRT